MQYPSYCGALHKNSIGIVALQLTYATTTSTTLERIVGFPSRWGQLFSRTRPCPR